MANLLQTIKPWWKALPYVVVSQSLLNLTAMRKVSII